MTGQSDNTLAMARQRIRHDDLIEIGMLNYDPMKAAYVKQCDALQDRINALETMLASLLDAIENANFIDYPVDEARALLEKE